MLDNEFGKSELLRVISPIRVISAGGFVAITHFKNRESTVDIDYSIDPDLHDNEDVKEDIRLATRAVAKEFEYRDDWFNDEMTLFTARSIRPKLFEESVDQGLILWQGKRLIIYAMKFEWALERKVRRLSYGSKGRDSKADLSDAVVILHSLVEQNSDRPVGREYVKQLNLNGFDLLPHESTLDVLADAYQKTYHRQGLE